MDQNEITETCSAVYMHAVNYVRILNTHLDWSYSVLLGNNESRTLALCTLWR